MHKNYYLYTINSVSKRDPKVKFYTCVERKTCRGRVHVRDGKYLKTVTDYIGRIVWFLLTFTVCLELGRQISSSTP